MISQKLNKCHGSGRAIGFGCGQKVYRFRYGLCKFCFSEWLYGTDEGKNLLQGTIKKAKKEANRPPKRKYIKWQDKEFQEMKKYVQDEICNPYIRARDINFGYGCISSGNQIEQAGHFYPTSTAPKLRFSPQNINGQSIYSNMHKHGDLENYRIGLIKVHGQKHFNELKNLKIESLKWPKLDKFELIKIGITYEQLTKKRIWCFSHLEFNNYKDLFNK